MSRAFEAPENDELVDEFFDFTKVSAPRSFLAPQKKIEVKIKVEQVEVIDGKREEKGIGYAKQPRLKEEQNLAAQSLNMPSTSAAINLFEDNDETLGIEDGREDPELPELTVFQRYLFNINPQKLPILEDRDNIIKKIHDNRVLVLSAMTGTGKSSQIPQYILEEAQKNMENCNIIITQPRRIAGKRSTIAVDTIHKISFCFQPSLLQNESRWNGNVWLDPSSATRWDWTNRWTSSRTQTRESSSAQLESWSGS